MECLFSDIRSKKHQNNRCGSKFFTFHSSLFTLFRTFAPDKSIKIAILERNYD